MLKYDKYTDEQLVSAYARGNNEAFDVLLNRHRAKLFNYIFSLVKDNDLADDIFQETFVKMIITIKQNRYNEQGKFTAWLFRIARNLVIDSFRQEKSEGTVSTDALEYDLLNRREYAEGTVEDTLIDRQIESDLHTLIGRLPDNQREVVALRYYSDLSFREIAEQTGVSINTALGRMRYALLNLRRMSRENEMSLTR